MFKILKVLRGHYTVIVFALLDDEGSVFIDSSCFDGFISVLKFFLREWKSNSEHRLLFQWYLNHEPLFSFITEPFVYVKKIVNKKNVL
jgi:hypothetical protein